MNKNWQADLDRMKELLSSSEATLKRLSYLLHVTSLMRVAVFGKYNHGKSTLLNALMGEEHFSVADKRETVQIEEFEKDDIVWIDTPGLDADVQGKDDELAQLTSSEKTDLVLLVHNVKTGELDKIERDLFRHMQKVDYRCKFVLVLTQIEQVTPEELIEVRQAIFKQIPDLVHFEVSSARYIKGKQLGKSELVDASGIPQLQDHIRLLAKNIAAVRNKEGTRLIRKIRVDLKKRIKANETGIIRSNHIRADQIQKFKHDVLDIRAKQDVYAEELDID